MGRVRTQPLFIHKLENNSQIFFPIQSTYNPFSKQKEQNMQIENHSCRVLEDTKESRLICLCTQIIHTTQKLSGRSIWIPQSSTQKIQLLMMPLSCMLPVLLCPDNVCICLILLVPQELRIAKPSS